MNKYVKITLSIVILLLIVFMLLYPKIDFFGKETPASERPTSNYRSIPVSGVVIRLATLEDKITVTGSIIPNESLELKSEVSGKISKISFKEGSQVKKGDLLVSINDEELQAEFQKLKYNLKLLKDGEFRQAKLLEKEAISQEEYDIALTELNTVRAEIKLQEARLAKTRIKAPFSGTIGLRHVSEGSYITPDQAIASLYNLDPAKIDFAIPEKYSNRVNIGDKIYFTTEATPDMSEGRVYAVEPQINQDTRTIHLRASSPNPKNRLLPGQFAKIEIIFNSIDNAIMVPSEAVIPELGGHKVYVNKGGKAESVPVKIGIRTASELEITSGLNENDTVITSGILQIRPGSDVGITLVN